MNKQVDMFFKAAMSLMLLTACDIKKYERFDNMPDEQRQMLIHSEQTCRKAIASLPSSKAISSSEWHIRQNSINDIVSVLFYDVNGLRAYNYTCRINSDFLVEELYFRNKSRKVYTVNYTDQLDASFKSPNHTPLH